MLCSILLCSIQVGGVFPLSNNASCKRRHFTHQEAAGNVHFTLALHQMGLYLKLVSHGKETFKTLKSCFRIIRRQILLLASRLYEHG